MKTQLATLLAVVVGATALLAQIPQTRIHSHPVVPSDEVLHRLNLHHAWSRAVPMDGLRDGIHYLEIIGPDLFVVTRSGLVIRLDAESGQVMWRTRVDRPYSISPFLAANSKSVYVIANAYLHSLDRATGAIRWEFPVPGGIAAPPEVDETQIYLSTFDNYLFAFSLPPSDSAINPDAAPTRTSGGYGRDNLVTRIRPLLRWSQQTNLELAFRPVHTANRLFVVSPDGRGETYIKQPEEGLGSTGLFRYRTNGRISVPPVGYGDIAYIGADDGILYALDLNSGKGVWRYTTGYRVTRQPVSLENDVFVTSERDGLARVDRTNGTAMWRIPRGGALLPSVVEADRFLAANDRFIYANDHSGRLLILDRQRGRRLSMLDTTAFRVPVVNTVTDRLYLAANNGLIVCLHDRDVREPIRHRRFLDKKVRDRLDQPVSEPAARQPIKLRDLLPQLTNRYALEFKVVEAAFKAANLPVPLDLNVTPARIDNKPLKDYLQSILTQVRATFDVAEQTVLIIPARPAAKP